MSRPEFVADTSAIIRRLRRDPAVESVFSGKRFGISLVTMAELTVGVLKSNSPEAAWNAVLGVVGDVEVFGVSSVTPLTYAKLYRELELRGSLIPVNDIWIAATCLEAQLPIVARDAHFNRVPGLKVINC